MDALECQPAGHFVSCTNQVLKNKLRSWERPPPVLIEPSDAVKTRFDAGVTMQNDVRTIKSKVLLQASAVPAVHRLLYSSPIRRFRIRSHR